MREKFPDAVTMLSLAGQAMRRPAETRKSHDEARVAYEAAVNEEMHYGRLVRRLIEHNGNKAISDGMTVWTPPDPGSPNPTAWDANTPEMLQLPEDMQEVPTVPVVRFWAAQVLDRDVWRFLCSSRPLGLTVVGEDADSWSDRGHAEKAASEFIVVSPPSADLRQYRAVPHPGLNNPQYAASR